MTRLLLALLLACAVVLPAAAVEPDEMLHDPALEQRARDLSANLRCLVCQNQSIDDSNAELARDLRVLVRERISAGDSDDQVMDYVVSRYGDFVLLNPPFKLQTLALWGGPVVFLLLGILGLVQFYRRRAATAGAAQAPLSDDERKRLDRLMRDDAP
ncbi:MAG: cytochrome c-type biogenesis protein CcmH [Rhodobacterales bacterium]|nr:cytochrome c-type biogenesis protein CcmH [Rhodobacterales bacterium]